MHSFFSHDPFISFCTILDSAYSHTFFLFTRSQIHPAMHASTLNHKPGIRMQKCSRLLCTTAGREKRARAHTNTHTNRCGDDWFEGFIGDSQSHQAGREEGAMHFQERRHLLQLNLGCFPRTLEDTDYVVLSCSYFTSTKVQILASEERRAPLHLLYEYNITDTDTWRTLIPFFLIFLLTNRHILSRTSGNSAPSLWVYEFQTCTVCYDRRLY